MLSLLYDLILRVIIIIALTDAIIFYLISIKSQKITRFGYGVLTFLVIVVTLIPLIINIWFVLWRYGVLNVRQEGRKLKGLTSKEHLFLRVLSTVIFINAVVFYNASRYMQTFVANFFEVIAFTTGLTLFVLTIQLLFWWKYLRKPDNQRFWVWDFWTLISRKPENSNQTELLFGF